MEGSERMIVKSKIDNPEIKKTLYDLELEYLLAKQQKLAIAEVYGTRADKRSFAKAVNESKARLAKLDAALNSQGSSASRFDSYSYWAFCKKWLKKHGRREAYVSAWRWYSHL